MTNEQTVIKENGKIADLKDQYMSSVEKVFLAKKNNEKISIEMLLECQKNGNAFFNHIESFVGNSGLLGAHNNLQWVNGFVEDCYAYLESVIFHYNFLRTYIEEFNNNGVDNIEPSAHSYANMQRLIKEYLTDKASTELREKFIKNNLPIYGFDMPLQEGDNSISKKQIIIGLILGICLVSVVFIISIYIPNPTTWQQFVFRGVFAIALALIAPVIPGFVKFTSKIKVLGSYYVIVGGGAIAIFLIIWLLNPPIL